MNTVQHVCNHWVGIRTNRMEMDGNIFEDAVGRLVAFTLNDGTRVKGDLVKIRDGVAEIHSLRNVWHVRLDDVVRVAIGAASGGVAA